MHADSRDQFKVKTTKRKIEKQSVRLTYFVPEVPAEEAAEIQRLFNEPVNPHAE